MQDSFPHALELSKMGYNAFALIYRPGAQTACEDLARAITLKNRKYIGKLKCGDVVLPGGCPALVSNELFEKVQAQIRAHAYAPNSKRDTYILQGKTFCGHCNAPMVGHSGHSHTGDKYLYYACTARVNQRSGCDKHNERRQWLEDYAVDMTIKYVLNPRIIDWLSEQIAIECQKDFDDSNFQELERKIAAVERQIISTVDASIGVSPESLKHYHSKIEQLDLQKNDLEAELLRLGAAKPLKLNKEQIKLYISQFVGGNKKDPEFRKQIIEHFLCNLYVYDDKLVIYFNIHGRKPPTPPDAPDNPPRAKYERPRATPMVRDLAAVLAKVVQPRPAPPRPAPPPICQAQTKLF
jgi:hypothetical protein